MYPIVRYLLGFWIIVMEIHVLGKYMGLYKNPVPICLTRNECYRFFLFFFLSFFHQNPHFNIAIQLGAYCLSNCPSPDKGSAGLKD